jgi:putative nucleotidyltransferase with HDIG domain
MEAVSRTQEGSGILDRCRFVRGIEAIPALPANVFNLMAKLYEPDISPREVERLLSLDPGLVMHVLRITNSLMFGLPSKILNVQRAVTVIGMTNLRQILNAYAVRLMHDNIRQSRLQQALWQHAIAVGALSRAISEERYNVVHAQAYVSGLLHDVGKVAMYLHDPQAYSQIFSDSTRICGGSVQLEYERFGFTHLEAGWMILDKMNFPRELREVAAFHHDPEFAPAANEMVWIVDLADRLSYHLQDDEPCPGLETHREKLQLSEEQILKIRLRGRSDLIGFQALY